MSRIDWPALERLALGQLGLLPRQFWALTPHEFALLAGVGDQSRPMTLGELLRLEREIAANGRQEQTGDFT